MGICRRYSRDRAAAEDILQESFIKIFSKIGQLNDASKLEGWLKSIVIKTAIDFYNIQKKTASTLIISDSPQNSEQVVHASDTISTDYLIAIINDLPDGCRIVFNLYEVEGYSHAEIAEMLGIAVGTSRTQLHQAKYLLRKKLKKTETSECYERIAK